MRELGATEKRAGVTEFPPLFDAARLAANEVPVDAADYLDDLDVDAGLSLETADAVGSVRAW